MKNEEINNAVLKIYDNKLFLDCNASPALIDIEYEGKIYAESKLPSGFLIMEAFGRIIIIRFKNVQMPETILDFIGDFSIKRARVFDESKKSVFATIDALSHNYRDVTSNWGDMESTWSSLYERRGKYFSSRKASKEEHLGHLPIKWDRVVAQKPSIIVNNNLMPSDIGNFYLSDGKKYNGDLHYNSQLGFFTGKKFTKDSTPLKKSKRAKKSKIRRRK